MRHINARGPTTVKPAAIRIAVAGHFGELVQGRLGPAGPVALVTLAAPAPVAETRYWPARGELRADEPLAGAAARATLRTLEAKGWGAKDWGTKDWGTKDWGGRLQTRLHAPRGGGAGGSTGIALGAVRAICASLGEGLRADEEAALVARVEGASDPLAFAPSPPRLWASREARTLKLLAPLPAMIVVGGFDGPGARTDPDDDDFPDMSEAFAMVEKACEAGDLSLLGAAATRSARANLARNPKPRWEALEGIGARLGARGAAVAHTGSAAALLFAPEAAAQAREARARLAEIGFEACVAFRPQYAGDALAPGGREA